MKKIIITILIIVAYIPISYSQSFDELIDSLIDNNTSLKAQYARIQSEIYDSKSENILSAPEADFEYLWGQRGAGDKLNIGIFQDFDWPGIYSARRKAIKNQSLALQFLSENNELEKRLEIKLLYIDIIYNKKNREILNERLDVMNQLIEKYSRGVTLGQFSRIDLNKLKIENIRIKNSLVNFETEAQILKASLEKLNGGKPSDRIFDLLNEYPEELILPEEEYQRLLIDSDPMANYDKYIVESQRYTVNAAKMAALPGFSLGYQYNKEDGEVFNGFSLGIKLPSFSSKTKVKAGEALSESLSYEKALRVAEREADMIANRNKALVLLKKYSDYKSVMKNDDSMRQLKHSLDAGEISIIDYLAETDFFIIATQEMLQLQYEYMIAAANLNKYKLLR